MKIATPRPATEDAEITLRFRVLRDPNEGLPQRLRALASLTGRRSLTADEKASVRVYRQQLARLVAAAGPTQAGATVWHVGPDGVLREKLPT